MLPILMPILGTLFSKVVDVVGNKLGVDMSSDEMKGKRLDIELELQKLASLAETQIQAANLRQIDVNVAEAQNANLFVAGWRPAVGWICAVALGYHFVGQPVIAFIAAALGHTIPLPVFDMQTLMTVLMGMLGLGAMRTYEKVYGTARDTLKVDGSYYDEHKKADFSAHKSGHLENGIWIQD